MDTSPPHGTAAASALPDRLAAIADDLASGMCTFWACPGPDEPYEHMMTCRVCASVQDLRAIVTGLDP